jgi:hypothetical protein
MDANLTEELLELEQAGWNALCDGTASEFYGSTMSEGALMVLANGQIMTRDDVVEALSQAPRWESYDITNARTVEITPDAAALVYVATGRRSGADDFVGVMTSVYRRQADGWQLTLFQQTPSPS